MATKERFARGDDIDEPVRGGASTVDDLVLSNGKGLVLELGVAVTPAPMLTRTIAGASWIEIPVFDPQRKLLKRTLLAERWDLELDGLRFRYPGGCSKEGDSLTLTVEDRWAARLREFKGPKKALRAKVTRAEFIKSLLDEAVPGLRFVCPQLHVKQPVKSARQAKAAKGKANEENGRGLTKAHGLKIQGVDATPEQVELGDMALRIAESKPCPYICKVAVIAALMDESSMGSASPGNVLQALEPYTQIRDAAGEISGFLFGEPEWTGVTAVGYHEEHPEATFYEICQAVQKSGAGESTAGAANYGKFGDDAREWVDAFEGGEWAGELGEDTVFEPYPFEVRKKENYWEAIRRLAKQVNWRFFIVDDNAFYMPEPELFQGMVRLAIDDETPGVENVDFECDGNNPVTECTVSAFINQWRPPPGSVVTLADHGPASIGFGDAPVKADAKGQKAGISGNRNAVTGEGRARYLVTSIEVPLSDDPAQRLATITLRKPTAPLPEPSPQSHSVDSGPGVVGEVGEMGVYSGSPEDIVNSVIDYAHTHGFPAVTRESVRAANASHGPTISGGTSDHQGPPDVRWAADISNGVTTPEETALAAAIAKAFGIPWDGAGLVSHEEQGYRLQLIYKTMEGGDHYNHVHFGCAVA